MTLTQRIEAANKEIDVHEMICHSCKPVVKTLFPSALRNILASVIEELTLEEAKIGDAEVKIKAPIDRYINDKFGVADMKEMAETMQVEGYNQAVAELLTKKKEIGL